MTAPVLLAAGGTGGHMFPAEALAGALVARGRRVVLATDRRGRGFGQALPEVETSVIRAAQPEGGVLSKGRAAVAMTLGFWQALRLLRRLRPAVVVGFGGYPSAPTVWAAGQQNLPILLHEPNAHAGRANRLLAPRARIIAAAFPVVRGLKPADQAKLRLVGNPVRPAFAQRRRPYAPPGADGPVRLLVLGGSQGARIFSELVPAALALLPADLRTRLSVSQQCRPEDLEAARLAYQAAGAAGELKSFFDDVPDRLAAAHLAICRAGASTVAELTVAGRPAILVPYPHAADDHQTANAEALADAGGAWVAPQPGLTPQGLADRLAALLADPAALARAAAAALAAGRPDAAERLADLVLSIARPDGAAGDRGRAEAAA